MYQYSLEWYINIFLNAIASAEQAGMYVCVSEETQHKMSLFLIMNVCTVYVHCRTVVYANILFL